MSFREARQLAVKQSRLTENFVFLLNLLNTSVVLVTPAAVIHYTSAGAWVRVCVCVCWGGGG
jgi:hypothetical protein